ncbi:MAG TPA: hypothetical protein VLT56_01015, partial [Desulfobacterales bacterium]|nr:hypothetical protein [Desulfobacterales bacterium]
SKWMACAAPFEIELELVRIDNGFKWFFLILLKPFWYQRPASKYWEAHHRPLERIGGIQHQQVQEPAVRIHGT